MYVYTGRLERCDRYIILFYELFNWKLFYKSTYICTYYFHIHTYIASMPLHCSSSFSLLIRLCLRVIAVEMCHGVRTYTESANRGGRARRCETGGDSECSLRATVRTRGVDQTASAREVDDRWKWKEEQEFVLSVGLAHSTNACVYRSSIHIFLYTYIYKDIFIKYYVYKQEWHTSQ